MKSQAEYLRPRTSGRRFMQLPLVRIVIAFLFMGAGILLAQAFILILRTALPPASPVFDLAAIAVSLVFIYLAYSLYVGLIERRPLSELAPDGAAGELGSGMLLGGGLMALIIGLLWLLGNYHVDGTNSWLVIFPALTANVPSGLLQEILFRGIIFRITEDALGTLWALLISVILFAAIHLFTAPASILSTFSSTAVAGVLLAAAYLLTRRLWLAIGLHVTWDFASDGIFGVGFSESTGQPLQGLLRGGLSGSNLLTGGAGGVESALLTALVIAAACVFLIWISMEKGRWRKRGKKRGQGSA